MVRFVEGAVGGTLSRDLAVCEVEDLLDGHFGGGGQIIVAGEEHLLNRAEEEGPDDEDDRGAEGIHCDRSVSVIMRIL